MQGNARTKKKKVSIQKTPKISKNLSPKASDTVKGSYHHNRPDLWDRGSMYRCIFERGLFVAVAMTWCRFSGGSHDRCWRIICQCGVAALFNTFHPSILGQDDVRLQR